MKYLKTGLFASLIAFSALASVAVYADGCTLPWWEEQCDVK